MSKALSFALGVLFFVGCEITIDKPIGKEFSAKEKSSLVGSWVSDEGSFWEVQKNKKADLVIGALSWDDKKNEFKVETIELFLTTIGQSEYAFFKSEGNFVFCRYVRKDDSNLELMIPDSKAFRKLVQESVAAAKVSGSKAIGVVEDENPDFSVNSDFAIKLSSESKALLEFFESPKIDACFDNKPFLKLKRIHK